MTGPREPAEDQPEVRPTLVTAPPRTRWAAIPSHLWRARTSTLVLSALFLTIGALYLNVRPAPVTPPADGASSVQEPAAPTTTPPPTTTTSTTTTAPTTTAPTEPTTTEPTSTEPTTEPTGTSTPEETTTVSPSSPVPPEPIPEPTSAPTG